MSLYNIEQVLVQYPPQVRAKLSRYSWIRVGKFPIFIYPIFSNFTLYSCCLQRLGNFSKDYSNSSVIRHKEKYVSTRRKKYPAFRGSLNRCGTKLTTKGRWILNRKLTLLVPHWAQLMSFGSLGSHSDLTLTSSQRLDVQSSFDLVFLSSVEQWVPKTSSLSVPRVQLYKWFSI